MKTPRFSVIIPTFNEEKFLPQLLESLVGQTKKDFEVIVVDGKSKDDTLGVAKKFVAKLPTLIVETVKKRGVPQQRNAGEAKARGEWLVFIDADSVLLPYFFERLESSLRDTTIAFCTAWFRPDSESANDAIITLICNIAIEGSLILKRPFAPGPLTIVRRDVFTAAGGYDTDRQYAEDSDFSMRVVGLGYALHVIRETLCVWSLRRFRSTGMMKTMQAYVRTVLSILVLKRAPKSIPGYIMGGHLYGKRTSGSNRSTLNALNKRIRSLMKEIFI